MRKPFILVAAVLLHGCASDGPRLAEAPKPPATDQLATVYLYYLGGAGSRIGFQVDQKALFSAEPVSFSWVQVPPGRHSFRAQVGFMQRDLAAPGDSTHNQPAELTLDLAAGQTYYLELATEGEMSRTDEHFILGVGIVGPQYTEHSKQLIVVDAEVAQWNLRPMTYVTPDFTQLPAPGQ